MTLLKMITVLLVTVLLGSGAAASETTELRTTLLAKADSAESKANVGQVFDKLQKAVDVLSGQSPGITPAAQVKLGDMMDLLDALNQAKKIGGLETVVAVLRDSVSDDLVRQQAMAELLQNDSYSISDLESICRAITFEFPDPNNELGGAQIERAWIRPSTFRHRMGAWVGSLLKVEIPNEEGPLSSIPGYSGTHYATNVVPHNGTMYLYDLPDGQYSITLIRQVAFYAPFAIASGSDFQVQGNDSATTKDIQLVLVPASAVPKTPHLNPWIIYVAAFICLLIAAVYFVVKRRRVQLPT